MKTKIFLIVATLCIKIPLYCQWLTQSAEGKGSFLFKGANGSFDFGKTSLSLAFNNLYNPFQLIEEESKDKYYIIFGGSLNAKNEESIGNLFSNGDFVPFGSAFGFLGLRITSSYQDQKANFNTSRDKTVTAITNKQIQRFKDTIKPLVRDVIISEIEDQAVKTKILNAWVNQAEVDKGIASFYAFINGENTAIGNEAVEYSRARVLDIINSLDELYDKELIPYQSMEFSYESFQVSPLRKFFFFGFSSGEASTFKRVEVIDPTNILGSFTKEEYRGGSLGIGINYQWGRIFKFGMTFDRRLTNNFGLLEKNEYKYSNSTKTGGETLNQEKTITAYSGKYGRAFINQLNVDFIISFKPEKNANTYIMINPYLRGVVSSNDQTTLPKSCAVGLGTYLFTVKSKFLGGLYVELNDVDNNVERQKPEIKQHIRKPYNRLTFGVLAKINLSSILPIDQ